MEDLMLRGTMSQYSRAAFCLMHHWYRAEMLPILNIYSCQWIVGKAERAERDLQLAGWEGIAGTQEKQKPGSRAGPTW